MLFFDSVDQDIIEMFEKGQLFSRQLNDEEAIIHG